MRFIFRQRKMDVILRPLFSVLNVPELKLKKPGWIQQPAPYTVFALVLLSYFLVTGRAGPSSQPPTPSLLLYSSPTSWSQVGQDPAASALHRALLLLGHR